MMRAVLNQWLTGVGLQAGGLPMVLTRVLCGLAALVGACTPVPKAEVIQPDPFTISLQAKGSCLAKGNVPYDASCMALLSFELVPLQGGAIIRRCYRFGPEERPASIFSVLQRGQFFSSVVTPGDYVVRVRGLHDKPGDFAAFDVATDGGLEDDCEGLELAIGDSRRWMLWGESAPITLSETPSDGGFALEVPVRVECRSCEGGCAGIATATCPAVFPPSYCAPSDNGNTCERICGIEQSCFDGEVVCEIPDGGVDGLCAPEEKGTTEFCTPCVDSSECPPDYTCVGTQNNRFCSRPCPAQLCPSGAVCKQVNVDILTY